MPNKNFWQFKAKENDSGELLLYGDISDTSWWGDEVTPKNFKEELDALGNIKTLNVFINSGGGDVFAGQAIYSILKRHSAQVNVYVDGLAASIASIIAMAGDHIFMPKNAMIMVHNPWSMAAGNSEDFRKLADDLDKVRESMISVYEDRTKMNSEEIIELLNAETWMTAEEALSYGFIDEVIKEKKLAASINNNIFNINGIAVNTLRYKNLQLNKIQFGDCILEDEPKENDPIIEQPIEEPVKESQTTAPLDLYRKLNQIHERRYNL